jgi:hypothetical protein
MLQKLLAKTSTPLVVWLWEHNLSVHLPEKYNLAKPASECHWVG